MTMLMPTFPRASGGRQPWTCSSSPPASLSPSTPVQLGQYRHVCRHVCVRFLTDPAVLTIWPPSSSCLLPSSTSLCRQRDRWMAELDLEPHNKAKVVVCSLHFRDGRPTKENPFPTELLGEQGKEAPVYRGRRPEEGQGAARSKEQEARSEANSLCGDMVNLVMGAVNGRIDGIEERREEEVVREKERQERRRREILAHSGVTYSLLTPRVKRSRRKHGRTALLPEGGVRKAFLPGGSFRTDLLQGGRFRKASRPDLLPGGRVRKAGKTSLLPGGRVRKAARPALLPGRRVRKRVRYRGRVTAGLQCRICRASFSFTRALYHHVTSVHCRAPREVELTVEETAAALATLYPAGHTAKRLDPKKKYVCAVCKSVCDLLGLFVHMKQVHHGLLCQYCLKLFKKVRDLEHHLAATHRLSSRYYSSLSRLAELSGRRATLACGECSVLLTLEQAELHSCSSRRQWECHLCKQVSCPVPAFSTHVDHAWSECEESSSTKALEL